MPSNPTVRAIAPGRIEIAGNHTDHQGGRVIAAAIGASVTMHLSRCGGNTAHLECGPFGSWHIDLSDLTPRDDEKGTTAALIRGVVSGCRDAGVPVAGFVGGVESALPAGGGLSSSAAFELALASGLACLYSSSALSPLDLARIGHSAETKWFDKPCGLMDQMSIAYGGICGFDFKDAEQPEATPVDFSFASSGYSCILIDVGCDHSRFTAEYAQVAHDMFDIAHLLDATRLADVPEALFLDELGRIRRELGDRAALRGQHYFYEMSLVDRRLDALRRGDMPAFLEATRRSGASSAQFLQNVSVGGSSDQPAMVALALAERALEGHGACRIHGGGFGGSIQAFVPHAAAGSFERFMESQLGSGSCKRISLSKQGARAQWL